MKKLLSTFVIAIALILLNNPLFSQETRELNIDTFSKIELDISADVYIELGDKQKVVVEGEKELIDLLETDVYNNTWEIDYSKNNVRAKTNLKIKIVVKNLDDIEINSSGDVTGKGVFTSEEFDISVNGSGDLEIKLDVQELDISINGSGDMNLTGKAKQVEIDINGSGDIDAKELICDNVEIDINGSGDISIHVEKSLNSSINGSGNVTYSGDPDTKIRSYGSGDVRHR